MKTYQYKLAWLFNNNIGDIKNATKVIKAIGARSLTIIYFRDENYKRIASYSRMVQYPSGLADTETIKAIKNIIKKDNNIKTIELIRK